MGKQVSFRTNDGRTLTGKVISVSHPTGRSRQKGFTILGTDGKGYAALERQHKVKFL